MPLWKTAKATFEATTNKKKPSTTWIGNIRKSTGIESALKDVDGSKTAADLRKSIVKLSAAATAYITLLDNTAKDPKAVPVADKSAYLTAIAKLKTDLEGLKAEGEKMATALDGADKKDKVDPKLLKEANDHIALREKAAANCPKYTAQFKKYLDEVTTAAVNAAKQLEAAKQAAKASNTMMHQVAVGVLHRYVEQSEPLFTKAQKEYRELTGDGSELMAGRLDLKAVFDALPASIQPAMKAKRDAPWKLVGAGTSAMGNMVGQIDHKVSEIKAMLSQAEASGNQMKDPQVYISELTKLKSEVEKMIQDNKIKSDRIVKGNEQVAGIAKQPPDVQANWYKNQLSQWERYQPDISLAIQKLKALYARAEVPRGAMEEKAIATLVTQVRAACTDGSEEFQTALLAGGQLAARINLQSQRLAKAQTS